MIERTRIPWLAVGLVALLGASLPPTAEAADGAVAVPAWPGVKFAAPVGLVSARDGTGDLYVMEQAGTVKRVPSGTGAPAPFLDLSAKVFPKLQGGLLGLAFHPRYAQNGRVFVCYLTETGDASLPFAIVVSEFRGQGGTCSAATERELLRVPKSLALHNAGCLVFGPDGMLYISTGDNKIQKEAVQTSQNPGSLLGKILRIDVDRPAAGRGYGIPADNPWATVGGAVRPEIYAYGLRNPWRFSFDSAGTLWTCEPGTKGVDCREAVVHVQRGQNHGWPFFQGTTPVEPVPANLQGTAFVKPVFEYRRPGEDSITAALGGFLYEGTAVPGLRGKYVFSDYGMNVLYAFDPRAGTIAAVTPLDRVSSLGRDDAGELYCCAHEEGVIYKLVAQP